jgi:hypothetical protein
MHNVAQTPEPCQQECDDAPCMVQDKVCVSSKLHTVPGGRKTAVVLSQGNVQGQALAALSSEKGKRST